MNSDQVFDKGVRASNEIFSNEVWVNMLVTDEKSVYDTQVYSVTFKPSARTHWHTHPGGQILLCTKGQGYYQEKGNPARLLKPGDVVTIPPDVNHWHGAAPDSEFVHIGMSTKVHTGPAAWLGPVTDTDYADATGK